MPLLYGGFPLDHTFNAEYLLPVFEQIACDWVPDLSREWQVEYDLEGVAQVSQSWVVPRHQLLPLAVRQMLSWNREKYSYHYSFRDWYDTTATPGYYDRPLVIVGARLSPMLTSWSPTTLTNHMQSVYSAKVANGEYPCGNCPNGVFPSIYTDKYRLDVTWARDEFTNRFGIKYAKIEIEPSIRLESITGASMGIVKIDPATGDPLLEPVDAPKANENLTTGFPCREPQTLMKVTYPWVRLGGSGANEFAVQTQSILQAGPLGIAKDVAMVAGKMPVGQYLGCVNSDWFLGYPRGRVLYQSASLLEKVSPVTGRLGYQITHDFLCLSTAEWNQARLQKLDPSESLDPADEQGQPLWPYGFVVATDKTRGVIISAGPPESPVFPYVYKDFDNLLYYGDSTSPTPDGEA